jgi:hypothetical protein
LVAAGVAALHHPVGVMQRRVALHASAGDARKYARHPLTVEVP